MSIRLGISSDEKDKVAMKENKNLRMHERYQTILLVLEGHSYDLDSRNA